MMVKVLGIVEVLTFGFVELGNRPFCATSGENPKNRPGFDNGNMYHSKKHVTILKNSSHICELQFQSHFCCKVVGVQIGWCR